MRVRNLRIREAFNTEHVFLVSGSDGVVAQVVVDEASGKRDLQFLHQDALGSVTLVTDSLGKVVARPYYEPFGKRIASDGAASRGPVGSLRLGLTGHAYDDELDLINMRGRMFDPQLKRMLTPDPFVTAPMFGQSYNRYSYVRNDPVNRVDPTGYEDEHGASCGGCSSPLDPIVVQIPTGDKPGGSGSGPMIYNHLQEGTSTPPPLVKSDVDGASSQGAEQSSWKDSAVVQAVGGFVVGFGLGVLPGGGVVDMTATAAGVLDEGTAEARLGKSLGEIAGGFVLTGLGVGGEAASWALSATCLGAVVGAPAAIVSAEAVVGGLGNIAVGAANLTQAMSTGAGGGVKTKVAPSAAREPPKPSAMPNFADPSQPPSSDFVWKGRDPARPGEKGNWVNPKTGEKFNPDLRHPDPIGPHYDYTAPDGTGYRLFPDGRILPK